MFEVREEPPTLATLQGYGEVSIAFPVESRLRVEPVRNGLGGWLITEQAVEHPWTKDYDAIEGEGPTRWASRFDISNWGVISVFQEAKRIGGAVIAFNTPGVYMLEGSPTLAVLWDIRVRPEHRRNGTGSLLFPHVVAWAKSRHCTHLKVETQDINVPACKFYARMGCELRAIHRDAYTDLPDETQLLWYKQL
ncbi:MAG: GNAT family N-acetyltransferase [Chloroflexi bacterium]|nr:GNAT family N-acetyltransferase [Chloroflexota bacterium]